MQSWSLQLELWAAIEELEALKSDLSTTVVGALSQVVPETVSKGSEGPDSASSKSSSLLFARQQVINGGGKVPFSAIVRAV